VDGVEAEEDDELPESDAAFAGLSPDFASDEPDFASDDLLSPDLPSPSAEAFIEPGFGFAA
jgi:hypothetical protein